MSCSSTTGCGWGNASTSLPGDMGLCSCSTRHYGGWLSPSLYCQIQIQVVICINLRLVLLWKGSFKSMVVIILRYSPIARLSSTYMLFFFVVNLELLMFLLDVKIASLCGLHMEVYVEWSGVYIAKGESMVCKFKKPFMDLSEVLDSGLRSFLQ